ncbi:MAG: alpha-mannosidase [Butyrivibrio sp.]|uniref:alpha-mannosidase n=1 Tax=Butyrivibrio sp. TaxID=28121 RepID=UPI001EB8FD90|nr:glycoside hydrolase family 38 C-terminal domain-containing protein [Butyrivibrio sp.]MBE5840670.1 alpha-mannosidase [Butyrivibrio sp.]
MGNLEKYNKIKATLEKLEKDLFSNVTPIGEVMTDDGLKILPVPYGKRESLFDDSLEWKEFEPGGVWGEPDKHYCFKVTVNIPDSFEGKEVLFFMSTGAEDIWNTNNPQMLVYINGVRRCGMDMNHNSLTIYDKEDWKNKKDRTVEIRIYAYSNLDKNENYLSLTLATRNEEVQKLYFDMKVPFEAMQAMLGIPSSKRESVLDTTAGAFEEQNKNVAVTEETFTGLSTKLSTTGENSVEIILDQLFKASNLLGVDYVENADAAINNCGKLTESSDYLRANLYGIVDNSVTVKSVGHTHIDVAWKWQIRQTREKVIRSYSTVMELMKKYPEYKFMASTPQMFEFVKEEEPELFEEIKEKIKEGRFEPEGAMWLEADCNLTSGESLVRQILYGKEYFKNEFGVDSKILWLPDVFGYSGALPQILKKSGVKAFMTTKLAWNDTNRMPNDLFIWEGIDGSSIPTYIITACDYDKAVEANETGKILNYTYNGRQNASQVMGTWEAFREKDITDTVLEVYGYGDGGGGPTWEMLEMDRRLHMGIPGIPKTEQGLVAEFFEDLLDRIKDNSNVPTWKDELYLEYHRGTYTSIGKNKKNNRRSEYLLSEAELLSVYAYLKGQDYPADQIKDLWKKVMLNQFHDILPGSSIEEVYIDSDKDYAEIKSAAERIVADAVEKSGLKDNKKWISTSEKDSSVDKKLTLTETGDETVVENQYYIISFDKNGEIYSLFDKEIGKELRHSEKEPLNRLIAFEDKPKEYDCWNIDDNFEDVSWSITSIDSITAKKESGKVVISISRTFRDSKINQDIVVYADSRRIDFVTKADWHEHQTLLKAAFPVDVQTDKITCEIQYGNIERNLKKETSWDKAKFECCAHKWIDMSTKADAGYGVAILNDSKYGYDSKENLMRLTLIKSGIFPNPNADQGQHEFTYSLFPHLGDYRQGRVVEEARALNEESHYSQAKELVEAVRNSIFELKDTEGVYVEAVKLAENKDGIVVRLYEGHGKSTEVTAAILKDFDIVPKEIYECDLLENRIDTGVQYDATSKEMKFGLEKFEIKTIKILF